MVVKDRNSIMGLPDCSLELGTLAYPRLARKARRRASKRGLENRRVDGCEQDGYIDLCFGETLLRIARKAVCMRDVAVTSGWLRQPALLAKE